MNYKLLLCTLITISQIPVTADWATQTLQTLTLDQKIGQLFMVAAHTDENINKLHAFRSPYTMHKKYIEHLIKNYYVGGIIYLGTSDAEKQLQHTRHYQQQSAIPLLIGQDCEWGFAMRCKATTKFPYTLTLGAIADNNLIYECGRAIGKQCHAVGVHINFAPVCDINSDPRNPIIGYRSFGADKHTVAQKASVFANGLADAGVIACAKHFPGHGNTNQDSHLMLPMINDDKQTIMDRELHPFKELITNNIPAVMTAHLAIPALDKSNCPASCSPAIVTDLLRNKLNFNGLIITDGLGMRGITNKYKNGDAELNAFLAGNDILLCPVNVTKAHVKIKQTVIAQNLYGKLDQHVLRILRAKETIFIKHDYQFPTTIDKNAFATNSLIKQLFDSAITIVQNTQQLIPLTLQNNQPITHHAFGSNHQAFTNFLKERFVLTKEHSYLQIITLHPPSHRPQDNFGVKQQTIDRIKNLCHKQKTILIIFGSPYLAQQFTNTPATIIVAYENNDYTHRATLKVLSGDIKSIGFLPI